MADYKEIVAELRPVKKIKKNPITGPGKYVMRNGNAVTLTHTERFPEALIGSNGMHYLIRAKDGNLVFGSGTTSAEDITGKWS